MSMYEHIGVSEGSFHRRGLIKDTHYLKHAYLVKTDNKHFLTKEDQTIDIICILILF